MPLEIRELIIRAFQGPPAEEAATKGNDSKKESQEQKPESEASDIRASIKKIIEQTQER